MTILDEANVFISNLTLSDFIIFIFVAQCQSESLHAKDQITGYPSKRFCLTVERINIIPKTLIHLQHQAWVKSSAGTKKTDTIGYSLVNHIQYIGASTASHIGWCCNDVYKCWVNDSIQDT